MDLQGIKRQVRNIFSVRAFDFFPFIKKSSIFLYDYKFSNGKSRYPLNITIDVTYRCNLNCDFCFLKKSVLNKVEQSKELTLEDIKKLLREVSGFKPSFFLTGGEPLVRTDLIEIVKLIKSYNLRCGINTNGILLTKEKAKKLSDSGLDYLFISVYDPEGIREKIKNITKLKKRPKVFINYVISPENLDFIDDSVEYAKDTAVDGIFLQHLSYSTKKDIDKDKPFCQKHFPEISHSFFGRKSFDEEFKKDLNKRLEILKEKAKRNKILLEFKPRELKREKLIKWYSDEFLFLNNCNYVWNVARIDSKGDIYPCFMYRINMGNIKSKKFLDIWNGEKFVRFRKLLKEKGVFPGCNRCCKL